jgi:hypothetical protein
VSMRMENITYMPQSGSLSSKLKFKWEADVVGVSAATYREDQ